MTLLTGQQQKHQELYLNWLSGHLETKSGSSSNTQVGSSVTASVTGSDASSYQAQMSCNSKAMQTNVKEPQELTATQTEGEHLRRTCYNKM